VYDFNLFLYYRELYVYCGRLNSDEFAENGMIFPQYN